MSLRSSMTAAGIVKAFAIASILAAQAAAPPAKKWVPPKTPDGQPDLQGTWVNATITPFERPAELAGKAVLTPEEAAAIEKKAAENRVDRPPSAGDVGNYNQVWFDSGTKVVSTRQTSLVVDPPDGKVPVRPAAEAQRAYDLAHISDSWEYMSPWDRCITRGVPGQLFPAGYNNAYQIIQTSGYIVILSEMIHEARVIPLDGRPHLPASTRQWNGDPRGRWEGNTLVVDTTNFNGKGWISTSAAGGRIRGIHESEALHLVERFTRIDPGTISYELTVDDPNTYTKPWKVAIPLTRDDKYRILEYACQEGNEAVANVLRAGRMAEKAAGEVRK
jgi:hypothetical protein